MLCGRSPFHGGDNQRTGGAVPSDAHGGDNQHPKSCRSRRPSKLIECTAVSSTWNPNLNPNPNPHPGP
eukprot:scaffold113317_cov51-Phaeocystis_antarctica.AAC.2